MTAVLLDTSVWRRFFAGKGASRIKPTLSALLDGDEQILMHVAVLGELVLGGLSAREETLLRRLSVAPQVADADVMLFIKHHKLMRCGIGWVDAHLLASALVAHARLWSVDGQLSKAAASLEIDFASNLLS